MRSRFFLLVLLAGLACDRDTSEPLVPGLNVLAGDNQTVAAGDVLQIVMLQLRNAQNQPVAGAQVIFESGGGVVSHDVATGSDSSSVARITDANGVARFTLRSQCPAGTFESAFHAPATNASAVLTTRVLPGPAAAALTQPSDTAVYVGARYTITARLVDNCGNVHQQNVTLRSVSSFVATIDSGRVTAQAIGRTELTGQLFGLSFSSFISVVPQGRMLAIGPDVRPLSIQFNGATPREYPLNGAAASVSKYAAAAPIPDSDDIVVAYGVPSRLYVAEPDGAARPLIVNAPVALDNEDGPVVTRSGWVYFFATSSDARSIWRVRLDGSQLERMLSDVPEHILERPWLDVSANENLLAFVARRTSDGTSQIGLLDLTTRAVTMRGISASIAKFSPDASRIAYVSNREVWTAPLEGPGAVRVSTTANYGTSRRDWPIGLSWSPDGRFILAEREAGGADIIERATSTTIALPFARTLVTPLWDL